MRRLREVLTTAAVAACALSGALTAAAQADPRLQALAPRFSSPVHVSGAPGDGERLYVVEKAGVVKVVKGGVATTFLDLTSVVQDDGEEGLLSIAFPPDFQTSRLFYVYFTASGGDNRVEELRAPSGDVADPSSRRLVLNLPHPGVSNHNGGQLQFGPDGMLYLAPGDGGIGRSANAQDLSSPLGKILRLDPRGGVVGSYTVPADNPFAADGGTRALIWSSGLRNPFRFSFDRATGDLVVGDVGEGTTEEIDWLPASGGAGRGANFGWNVCEGSFATGSVSTPCPLAGSVRPVLDLLHDDGYVALIAGYVVRDPSLPSLFGRVIWGDNGKPELSSAVPADARATARATGLSIPGLTSFGEDAGGCLYATAGGGTVYRIVENDTAVPCAPAAPPGGGGTPTPPVGDGGGGRTTTPSRTTRRSANGVAGWSVPSLQRVLRNGGVLILAYCPNGCRLSANATLKAGRRRYALKRAVRRYGDRAHARLLLRLTPRARRALRAALRRGGKPVVVVRYRITVGGTAMGVARRAVRIQR